ncbi:MULTISPECIES: hypothetical protein [unclassified Streptomyces]|uniref:hypothetical protein n=1 Tax=unclassified Streptomyces TaxID=2593676 RepID=UPI0004CB5E85|nr:MULTISPECIES: hypothetical protein [unclassified Streptomyces]KOV86074.1 hypothetical protein ADL02_19465 [Streptomyces sp. NRRL WC-3723]
MANAHKHRQRVIRGADDQLWEDLDAATKAAGTDRSAVTRQFWEWYVGRDGARVPERPASSEETSA